MSRYDQLKNQVNYVLQWLGIQSAQNEEGIGLLTALEEGQLSESGSFTTVPVGGVISETEEDTSSFHSQITEHLPQLDHDVGAVESTRLEGPPQPQVADDTSTMESRSLELPLPPRVDEDGGALESTSTEVPPPPQATGDASVVASTSFQPLQVQSSLVPRNDLRYDLQFAEPQHLSYHSIVLMGVYSFCGTTFLSAPYAVSEGGWISIFFLPLITLLAYKSSILLEACSSEQTARYDDIGAAAFPQFGQLFIQILSCLLLYATCIGILILQMDNLEYVFPGWGHGLTWALLLIVFLILLLFNNIRNENIWITGPGVFFILVVALLLGFSWLGVGKFAQDSKLANISGIHTTFGFYVYFLASHGTMPVIYKSLREKHHYRRVVIWIMAITTTLYGGIAFMGYGMFGAHVKPAFTLNMPRNLWLSYMTILFTGLDHILRYLLNITPVISFFNWLLVERVPQSEQSNRYQSLIRFAIKLLLPLITIGPAILYKEHDEIYVELLTLGGAILGVFMAFVVPSICFFQIKGWNGITCHQRTSALVILMVGIAGAVVTTFKSIADIKT